ncbi:MAG: 2Fe-2S iron-sulfur cluster-binding protein [Spirochaetes bacterium]|nr:2Fe-2S iron-sulfur cluster-binding protein [Spirochaetota bacterium]
MPELFVDGRPVSVSKGVTLLDATKRLGIPIPTLCFREGLPHHTSCMVCLVEDERSGRLVPACATQASDGDRVRTCGERVVAARRRSVELLLAEHDCDCEAPCTRACPAHADIPDAIRRIAAGDWLAALARIMERLPLAWTLAVVCPAPCRQACRRKRVDSAVDICGLKRAAAETGLTGADPFTPPALPSTGKNVAIVGAGPAGLSAAYFLARNGHRCVVFDGRDHPGDMLPAPPEVLEADVGVLRRLDIEFRTGRAVGPGSELEGIRMEHDALVLATGSRESLYALLPDAGHVDRTTGVCSLPGVFVCGNATLEQPTRLAVRSVADGMKVALTVASFLAGRPPEPEPRRFDSRRGVLSVEDLAMLAQRAAGKSGAQSGGATSAPAPDADITEAPRCLDCDCLRKDSCRLRRLADELGADARRYAGTESRRIELVAGGSGLSLEPGKCIKCGICVRIAEAAGDRPGLSFSGRGPEARVRVPFGDDIGRALPSSAAACVAACPTGALTWDTAGRKGARE